MEDKQNHANIPVQLGMCLAVDQICSMEKQALIDAHLSIDRSAEEIMLVKQEMHNFRLLL